MCMHIYLLTLLFRCVHVPIIHNFPFPFQSRRASSASVSAISEMARSETVEANLRSPLLASGSSYGGTTSYGASDDRTTEPYETSGGEFCFVLP